MELWVASAEIQALAVDNRTVVWVSTAEKIVVREIRNFLECLGW